jgi:hypothetical protein
VTRIPPIGREQLGLEPLSLDFDELSRIELVAERQFQISNLLTAPAATKRRLGRLSRHADACRSRSLWRSGHSAIEMRSAVYIFIIQQHKMRENNGKEKLTTRNGAPVADIQNTMTAGPRGPLLL